MTRGPRPAPLHRARVERHRLAPRWIVPSQEVTVPAIDSAHARELVVLGAHRAADVPPIRSLVRESMCHASATAINEPNGEPVQLEPAA